MTALFKEGSDWATFKIVEGTAQLQLLQLGAFNQTTAEVTRGLTVGDTVTQFPGDTLTSGTLIAVE